MNDTLTILAIPPSKLQSLSLGFVNEGEEQLLQDISFIEINIR